MNKAINGQPLNGYSRKPQPSTDYNPANASTQIVPLPNPDLDLAGTRITEDTDVPPVEPTISIKGAIFAVKGDISFISGPPKSGKSTTSRPILYTALIPHIPSTMDTLGIRACYCEGRPVVYIDTEQPRAYTKRMAQEIQRVINNGPLPANLYMYNWRQFTFQQNRQAIEQLMKELPDAAYWIIDGVTDFILGANDEKESNEIIRFFMSAASNLNTTIVLLIHENAGSSKLRGHIGSEAERRCGGAISIRKDKQLGVHWIESKYSRGSADFEKYAFHYNKDQRRFTLCDDAETKKLVAQQDKSSAERAELYRLADLIFGERERLPKQAIKDGLKFLTPHKSTQNPDSYQKAIDRLFNLMVGKNVITPIGEAKDNFHYLRPVEASLF